MFSQSIYNKNGFSHVMLLKVTNKFLKFWYSKENNVFLRTKFHSEQGLLYEKSKIVSEKLNPRGTAGPLLG